MLDWKTPAFLFAFLFALLAACASRAESPVSTNANNTTNAAAPASENLPQMFQARGVIKELDPDGKTVVIAHEMIPGYMPAMTMAFVDKNPGELTGLRTNDSVSFRLNVTGTEGWIDHVTKTGEVQVIQDAGSIHPIVHVVRDVQELSPGDELPEDHFTNELGRRISISQFRGQALAFTFFFTRCPFPNYCPFVSHGFEEAQKKLEAMTNAPTNWHLISVSFDPEFDTPATLKTYAVAHNYDPAHWSFVSGNVDDLTVFGDQFGEYFGKDPSGGINHNLRTVIVNAQGRVQKIFIGNTWTSDEVVAEILKAAAAR